MDPTPPPGLPDAFDRRGALVALRGDTARARTDYNDAILIDPEVEISYLNRGSLSVSLGRLDEAMADFEHHLRLRPDSALGLLTRGRLFQKQHKDEAAL